MQTPQHLENECKYLVEIKSNSYIKEFEKMSTVKKSSAVGKEEKRTAMPNGAFYNQGGISSGPVF